MSETAIFMNVVPVAGVSEGISPGLKTAYAGAADDATREAALARAVADFSVPNERLLAFAARNPPPQSWYDKDEDLF